MFVWRRCGVLLKIFRDVWFVWFDFDFVFVFFIIYDVLNSVLILIVEWGCFDVGVGLNIGVILDKFFVIYFNVVYFFIYRILCWVLFLWV